MSSPLQRYVIILVVLFISSSTAILSYSDRNNEFVPKSSFMYCRLTPVNMITEEVLYSVEIFDGTPVDLNNGFYLVHNYTLERSCDCTCNNPSSINR